ncbi:GPI inositol-deacylase [Chloropicon primus]|uniref:GPI inositol-deacylase n=1 Tax=Chloropicon primus TaxID=1764295 RepID=A0A5B8MBQ9_9CHLO|nr:GPI inositol-deacylase [Chloropicon primus]|eukprot:QDZ17504.1 GPI inositol-deacylase [Chloropicon primus]
MRRPGRGRSRSSASRSNVLLCPGLLFSSKRYEDMRRELLKLGHPRVEVLPVKSWDWLPSLLLGEPFGWYLDRMEGLAADLLEDSSVLSVVGHSAGGWLSRIWLSGETYNGKRYNNNSVETLLTLGTPHLSVEEYPFGRVKESRRGEEGLAMSKSARSSSLQFANEFAGAPKLLAQGCEVVCVAGSAVDGSEGDWLTQTSYKSTCRAYEGVDGDGVCPVESAILPGCSESLVVRDVGHGPSNLRPWYGSPLVVGEWDLLLR